MWLVMTSSAKMPGTCWGQYRRVALVNVPYWLANQGWRPAMISDRSRGIVTPHGMRSGIIDMGHHNVGKNIRSAYARTVAAAEARAQRLNNTAPEAVPSEIMTWGGSA